MPTEPLACGAKRVLSNLYYFGANSFLLVGDNREGLVIDPTLPDIEDLIPLMKETGVASITAATATHFHRDHSDGLNWVRTRFNTPVWVHPWVAKPLLDRNRYDLPWLPSDPIEPDRTLPATGSFRWNRYRFQIRPFPGQTWWHCAFDTEVNGRHVLFSGDNFQPPSRWNGTGGFCSYNGCRFSDGFGRSASVALEISPDLVCNGHGCIYEFHAPHYRKILRWAARAEKAVRDLCPTGSWLQDYDCRLFTWDPYRTETLPGATFTCRLQISNHTQKSGSALALPVAPDGWITRPGRRSLRIPANSTRHAGFTFRLPRKTSPGRYLIGADITLNGKAIGEPAVAMVDVK